MIGHIFDIDTLISVDSHPWIVDKNNPNNPLMKISKTDYNLFKNGVYKKQGNKIEYNGKTYWLPSDVFEKLKVIAKKNKIRAGRVRSLRRKGFICQTFGCIGKFCAVSVGSSVVLYS